jgi:hypothetical protein
MATGKTNAKYIRVWVDDETNTLRDISSDVTNVDIPQVWDQTDVSGYSDGVTNITVGRPGNNVTMDGVFNNAANKSHAVLDAIAGFVTTTTGLKIQIGILAAPSGTDPEWTGEYYCVEYSLAGDLTWHASFMPAGSSLGNWGTYT